MKKYACSLFVLIVISIESYAQIPNSGFENWTTVGNCVEPTGWYGFYSLLNSSGSYCPLTKSTDHYPASIGSFSARITNDTAIWNTGIDPDYLLGWGILTTTKLDDKPLFPVTGHPKALCGYYKFIPQNGDSMEISIIFYKNGVEITRGFYESTIAAPNWTPFKIFVNDTLYSSVDSARISFASAHEPKNGSRPHGNSVLYIDNLSFDGLITSVADPASKNSLFNLYPVPASDIVTLNINNTKIKDLEINIYSITGELVRSEILIQNHRQINTGDLSNGIYMFEIRTKEWSANQKLIIQR